MKFLNSIALLGLTVSAFAAPVPPIVVNAGDSFGVTFDGRITLPTTPPTLGPRVDFLSSLINFSEFAFVDEVALSRTRVDFRMDVFNTSTAPLTASTVSVVGFNTTPTITGGSATGIFGTVYRADVLPGAGLVEFCTSTTLSCAGTSAGVSQGTGGTAYVSLYFAGAGLTSLTIDDLAVRYVGLTGVRDAFNGVGAPVPEPIAYVVLVLGLIAIVVRRRYAAI